MAQVKIFGVKESLNPIKSKLSEVIHSCVVDAFQMPFDKRFHRFFPMDKDDFFYAPGRTAAYTIIEITINETPKSNWGIRGLPGDELELNYKLNI